MMRVVFCSLLFVACLPVAARDALSTETGGDTPCQTAAATDARAASDAGSGTSRPAHAASASKTRAPSTGGGDSEGIARPPRWHSFLPGMFR